MAIRIHIIGAGVSGLAAGGGLPPAGTNGRVLAKRICRNYGRGFRTQP
jgi:2-polyprenyl-6-methoxyphenol hydroxylase-like FAD-dependent oxidoreductase